jgi:quercetin dioxygenase-like cupin family protein
MNIIRNGSQPSNVGPDAWFTGTVRIDAPFKGTGNMTISGGLVTFEPCARSAWHTHPRGQVLIVTAGKGWTQCEGEAIVEINAGDVIICPPGHKHWHGASATTAMTHIAVQESVDGVAVNWLDKVTDEEYFVGPTHV